MEIMEVSGSIAAPPRLDQSDERPPKVVQTERTAKRKSNHQKKKKTQRVSSKYAKMATKSFGSDNSEHSYSRSVGQIDYSASASE